RDRAEALERHIGRLGRLLRKSAGRAGGQQGGCDGGAMQLHVESCDVMAAARTEKCRQPGVGKTRSNNRRLGSSAAQAPASAVISVDQDATGGARGLALAHANNGWGER